MPWTAFAANGLWVLVIGLMGPAVPFIIKEFSIDYAQAGLIFTLLSIAALIGGFVGGWVSDYRRRKSFWLIFLIMLSAGLVIISVVPTFSFLLIVVFVMSLFGSPIGAVGQSIMLQIYPGKRGRFLSLSTMFAAVGSLAAPILISIASIAGLGWRGAFFATAALVLMLFAAVSVSKLPKPAVQSGSALSVFGLFADRQVLYAGVMIFLCVGLDIGFSYWLAEYFVSCAGTAAELSGFAVGCYLAGVISGRFVNSRKPEGFNLWKLPVIGLAAAAVSLLFFLNVTSVPMKLVFCFIYGIGVGPSFPSMMSAGTALYPQRSGAVTAVLFSMMSFSGAVFPVIIGAVGTGRGIENAYYALFFIMVPIAAGLIAGSRVIRPRS